MADEFDRKVPLITKLMLVMLCDAAAAGERVSSFRALRRTLREADPGGHKLVERIKTPPVTEADMQKVFDAGYAKRVADETAQRQRNATALVARSLDGSADGVNGYGWREVLAHCVANKQRIRNDYEANFVESVADQMAACWNGSIPTAKQAPILRRIFLRWFSGRI